MLNIFHTGGITLGLTLVLLFLLFMFWKDLGHAMKQPYGRYTPSGFVQKAETTKFYQINKFWFGVAVIVLYAVTLVLFVAPDYKGI